MIALGTVRPGRTIYIPFETFASSTGAPITLTGLATSDIQIYKDGGTTQRASAAGITLLDTDGIDFDGLTGIHGFSIDLADNTTADFYQSGSRYFVVVSDVTVDSQTMRFVAATFEIGYPDAVLNTFIATLASQTSFTLNVGPAEDDALNGMEVMIHDAASAVQWGRAIVSDYTGATKTVTLAAGTTFTVAAKDNISIMSGLSPLPPTVAGRALDVSTGGEAGLDWANIGSPTTTVGLSGTTVKTATDVETDTQDIQSRIPAALGANGNIKADVRDYSGTAGTFSSGRPEVNTTHIAGSAVSTSSAQIGVNVVNAAGTAWASGAITSSVLATGCIGASQIANGAIDRATFAAETGMQSARSNTAQSATASTIVLDASASSVDDFYNDMFIYITGSPGIGQCRRIRDYVGATKTATITPNWVTNPDSSSTFAIMPMSSSWDETIADHLDSGSVGAALNAVSAGADPWSTALPGAYASGTAGFILGTQSFAVASGGITSASFASGAITAAAIAADAIGASELAADAATEIADAVLSRNVSNVESTAGEHTLCTIVLATLESAISGTDWTIKRTDGSTTHATKTLTVLAGASPIVGVA